MEAAARDHIEEIRRTKFSIGGEQNPLTEDLHQADITSTGAPATLLIFNNEKGFSSKNIDSICSVGRSMKKGNRKRGYIGEKELKTHDYR
ncbi:hypothetical protein CFP56_007692 [Quercus suber]|uniref:Uncharacterized protein n=1 Tax=Quercus suber TaxID=58331 RepID=A0AAW0L707_QUESU